MDIGVRAAQLISEVTPHIFLTAAQVTLQQNSNTNTRTTNSSTPPSSQVKSEICEPFVRSNMATDAVEKDRTPLSDEENDADQGAEEEEFEVEEILETKMSGRKRLFKVRWKNYGPEWDTWEPEDVLKDGAEESMKEFMIKYEAERKKNSKSRKRPSATPASASKTTRSRRSTVEDADDESLPAATSEDDDDDDDGFTPKKKKTKSANTGKTPTPTRTRTSGRTTTATPTKPSSNASSAATATAHITQSKNGFLSNKTPWFMSSSSEDEGNEKLTDTNSKLSTTPKDEKATASDSLKIVIPKNQKPNNNNDEDEEEDQSDAKDVEVDEGSSSKKHKKDKHKKKNKKPKVELIFKGICRTNRGEPLTFVVQQAGADQALTYSAEEALEADPKSLARFLMDKVTFDREGIPAVNVINAGNGV